MKVLLLFKPLKKTFCHLYLQSYPFSHYPQYCTDNRLVPIHLSASHFDLIPQSGHPPFSDLCQTWMCSHTHYWGLIKVLIFPLSQHCEWHCEPGCYCTEGKVLSANGTVCLEKEDCPCLDLNTGRRLEPGDTIEAIDGCNNWSELYKHKKHT